MHRMVTSSKFVLMKHEKLQKQWYYCVFLVSCCLLFIYIPLLSNNFYSLVFWFPSECTFQPLLKPKCQKLLFIFWHSCVVHIVSTMLHFTPYLFHSCFYQYLLTSFYSCFMTSAHITPSFISSFVSINPLYQNIQCDS